MAKARPSVGRGRLVVAAGRRECWQPSPAPFADLPEPDAVFLGGLGRDTTGVVGPALARLRPGDALVANVASLEGAHALAVALRQQVGRVRLLMVNLARGVDQLDTIRFEAANPSFLLSVQKPV